MPLQIIGAGLGRTGTLSTKAALEQLGFGPCYHMTELLADLSRLPAWQQAAEGRPGWDMVFDGYAATVDYPGCTFWRELADYYPSAKVLLTVRDPQAWFDSARATIFSRRMRTRTAGSSLDELLTKLAWREFGRRIFDPEAMKAAFRRHRAAVERAIAPERLLVYEVDQGWEPLCAFLHVPVPASPFPHLNSREETQKMISKSDCAAGARPSIDQMSDHIRAHVEARSSDAWQRRRHYPKAADER